MPILNWLRRTMLAVLVALNLGGGALAQDAPVVGVAPVAIEDTSRSTTMVRSIIVQSISVILEHVRVPTT